MIEDGSVVHEVFYPHPPGRVWDALTDPAETAWLSSGRPHCNVDREIVRADPPCRLSWRWVSPYGSTIVDLVLRAEGSGTRLRVEHGALPEILHDRLGHLFREA